MYRIQEIDGTRYTVYPSAIGNVQSSSVDKIEEAVIVEEAAVQVHHIEPAVYEALVQQVTEAIRGKLEVSDLEVEIVHGNVTYTLCLSAFIYTREVNYPEGTFTEVSDIVPIWWELHSYATRSCSKF